MLVTAIFLIFIVMAIQSSPRNSPRWLWQFVTVQFDRSWLPVPGGLPDQYDLHAWFPDAGRYGCKQRYFVVVDTVNQLRVEMPLDEALVEAGAIRVRPICMTTLTTIIAMIPNCLAFGKAGKMMQGLALVNVGGLVAATILTLVLLPSFYRVVYNMGKGKEDEYDKLDCD